MNVEIVFESSTSTQLIDITEAVNDELKREGVLDGICQVFTPHTTAGVTINEHADPSVAEDLLDALERMVPGLAWRHLEGNSPAHVKAVLVGPSQLVPVRGGRLALGRWQGIFLCEFDGPRRRKVWIQTVS